MTTYLPKASSAPQPRNCTFGTTELAVFDLDGRPWISAEQVGIALGLNNPRDTANRLFLRNEDEFEPGVDSRTVKLTALDNRLRETRVFSQTGCILLAFFSASDQAKAFRQWAKQALASALDQRRIQPTNTPARTARDQQLLKALRPELANLARYHRLGLNSGEISRLMAMNPGSVHHALKKLQGLELLPPPNQPPMTIH